MLADIQRFGQRFGEGGVCPFQNVRLRIHSYFSSFNPNPVLLALLATPPVRGRDRERIPAVSFT